MEIKHNGKDIELSFGFKFMNDVDKKLGMEMEQMSIGQGIQMLVPNLQDGNPVAIGHTIIAATSHHKKAPKSDEEISAVLDEIADEQGFDEFAEQVITELGKRPMTRNLVPEEYREVKKAKK
ncbi:tail assembly chaperone [Staphylococcus arlettae]|uniref:tail assembly chaperone n=1 Tax=Staphylococcus TaxID=1279 RepID=UPI000623BE13|nr:tail assembly chaperone [Staphylococcus equorum]KKI55471.1 Phage protein [Staphylococcus equorum subsp. equorum]OEK56594.1 phage tail protein [Staphylococcus equorum]OEK63600.1 phage tail protein [Staphylococcus equorum]OEK64944.1 phage tail protein [Staphylococcus equorum]QPT00122.1 tail assembly chaperone [Staphylococcus equorum]